MFRLVIFCYFRYRINFTFSQHENYSYRKALAAIFSCIYATIHFRERCIAVAFERLCSGFTYCYAGKDVYPIWRIIYLAFIHCFTAKCYAT